MSKFYFAKGGTKLVVDYGFPVGDWFKSLFYEMGQAYYYSASKDPDLCLLDVTEEMRGLILSYYEYMKIPINRDKYIPLRIPPARVHYQPDDEKCVIAMSGGKDCIHLLLRLLEMGWKKENILCMYVENLNRSESPYEKVAMAAVCEKAGVQYQVLQVNNSIKINREGHNIGLREQLISTLAAPLLVKWGTRTLFFGNKIKGGVQAIFCTQDLPYSFLQTRMEKAGIDFNMMIHPDFEKEISDVDITNDMLERYPEYLTISSSCYAQKNFREIKHDKLQEKMPSIPIYHGCGHCQKCMIINGCIYLKTRYEGHPGHIHALKQHLIKKYQEKFTENKDIKHLMELINV